MGNALYRPLPLGWTAPFALRTTDWLNEAGVPVLVMHGTRDAVIPYALGKKLYDGLRVPKEMLTSHAGHCEIPLFEAAALLRYRHPIRSEGGSMKTVSVAWFPWRCSSPLAATTTPRHAHHHAHSRARSGVGHRWPMPAASSGNANAPPDRLNVPVEYHKLDNGLKVVLSPDHTAPTATVAVYYNIGFRVEPRDRTGFAHLFEHLMFQGSENLGKMEFIKLIQSNGGVLNGSTRFDFTNYFEIVPAHTLETMLWAEADRMRGLAINRGEPARTSRTS